MKRILLLLPFLAACHASPTQPLQFGDTQQCVWELDSLSGLQYCDYPALPQSVAARATTAAELVGKAP